MSEDKINQLSQVMLQYLGLKYKESRKALVDWFVKGTIVIDDDLPADIKSELNIVNTVVSQLNESKNNEHYKSLFAYIYEAMNSFHTKMYSGGMMGGARSLSSVRRTVRRKSHTHA